MFRAAAGFRKESNGPQNTFWRAVQVVDITKPSDATVSAAEKVPSLTPGKPTLLYFGGMLAMSEQKGYIDRVMTRLERFVSPQEYSLEDFDIVTATYANGSATHKTANIYAYQDDPLHFASDQARYLVEVGMLPLIGEVDEWSQAKRFEDPEKLYHNLSMLSIIGYSYGTCYVQECRNALRAKLEEMDYSPEETAHAISLVGGLNLGLVNDVVDKTAEGGDFIQVTAVGDNDKRTHVRTQVRAQVGEDPSPTLKQAKIGNNLVLYGVGIDNKMRGFFLEDSGFNEPGFAKMLAVKSNTRDDPTGHGIEGYLRITRRRPDDGLNTLQKNPATQFIRQFIEQAITGSILQARGEGTRDLKGILGKLESQMLQPSAIEATAARMAEEKKLYDWVSSLSPENAAMRLRTRLEERGINTEEIDKIAPLPDNSSGTPPRK